MWDIAPSGDVSGVSGYLVDMSIQMVGAMGRAEVAAAAASAAHARALEGHTAAVRAYMNAAAGRRGQHAGGDRRDPGGAEGAPVASWPAALAGWAGAERAAGHSRETVRTRGSYLARFAAAHPDGPGSVTPQMVTVWLARRDWSPATRKSAQGALRSYFRWALGAGGVDRDPTALLAPVRVPERLPVPAAAAAAAAERTIACPDRRLMVALAARMGLRRSEIARVATADVLPQGLLVHGKGGRQRVVPMPPDVRAEIARRPAGFVFPGRFGGHVHPQTVADWIRQETGSSPHPLRTRFATRAYRGTKDLFGVQKVLGHASPETTMVYTRIDTDDLAAVMAAAWAD